MENHKTQSIKSPSLSVVCEKPKPELVLARGIVTIGQGKALSLAGVIFRMGLTH